MTDGTCLRCGATEVYRREGGVVDPGGGPIFIRSGKLLSRGPVLDALACAACGYVILEVAEEQRAALRAVLQRDGWQHVKPQE